MSKGLTWTIKQKRSENKVGWQTKRWIEPLSSKESVTWNDMVEVVGIILPDVKVQSLVKHPPTHHPFTVNSHHDILV